MAALEIDIRRMSHWLGSQAGLRVVGVDAGFGLMQWQSIRPAERIRQ